MREIYHNKILGSWVKSLYPLPRWTSTNARPTLSDPLTTPSTGVITQGSFAQFTTTVPSGWYLTDSSPSSSGILIERLMETIAHELQIFSLCYTSVNLSSHFYFDTAEREYGLLVPVPEESIESVKINHYSSGTTEINEAPSENALFWAPRWSYRRGNGNLLICGLGTQQIASERRTGQGDWQFIASATQWSSGNVLFWEHPETKNWVPVHPDNIRSDGFLNLNYDGTLNLRSVSTVAASALDGLTVLVNSQTREAQRVNFWNSVDDKALWVGLDREDGETNNSLSESILLCSWFGLQTQNGLRDFVSSALRQGTVSLVSAAATGFNVPGTSTGFTIKDLLDYGYVTERIPEDVDTTRFFRSLYSSPDLGVCWYGNVPVGFSSVSGSVYQLDTFVDNNRTYGPLFSWRLKYWTDNGSSVSFSSNLPQTLPSFLVYLPSKVRVPDPSYSLLRRSFKDTAPSLKWQLFPRDGEKTDGSASFM